MHTGSLTYFCVTSINSPVCHHKHALTHGKLMQLNLSSHLEVFEWWPFWSAPVLAKRLSDEFNLTIQLYAKEDGNKWGKACDGKDQYLSFPNKRNVSKGYTSTARKQDLWSSNQTSKCCLVSDSASQAQAECNLTHPSTRSKAWGLCPWKMDHFRHPF